MLSQPTDGRLLTSPLGLSSVRRKSAGAPVYDDGTPGVLVRRFFSFFLSLSLFFVARPSPFKTFHCEFVRKILMVKRYYHGAWTKSSKSLSGLRVCLYDVTRCGDRYPRLFVNYTIRTKDSHSCLSGGAGCTDIRPHVSPA